MFNERLKQAKVYAGVDIREGDAGQVEEQPYDEIDKFLILSGNVHIDLLIISGQLEYR